MRMIEKLKRLLCRHQWERSMFVVLGEREADIWCPRCGKHRR